MVLRLKMGYRKTIHGWTWTKLIKEIVILKRKPFSIQFWFLVLKGTFALLTQFEGIVFFFKHIWFTFWFHVHFPECKWFQPIFSPPPRCESLRRVPFWHLDLWALIRSVANFPWENTGNQKVDWFPHEKPKKNKAGDFWWGKPTTRLIILLGDLNFCCF